MGTKFNKELEFDAHSFIQDPFVVEIQEKTLKLTGLELPAEARAELIELVKKSCHTFKTELVSAPKDIIDNRNKEYAKRQVFPVETFLPFVAIKELTSLSDNVKMGNKWTEFDFTFDKLNLMTPKQKKALKAIKGGEFSKETNAQDEEALIQVLLDDNFANGALSIVTSIDKKWSLRELLKDNEKA